jgi:hypothetical protein
MRRTIIKQGNNSYTVTLPAKWISQKGLDAKSEVDVQILNDTVIISAQTSIKSTNIHIDFGKFKSVSEELQKTIITEIYRKGYDIITITNFPSYKTIATIVHSRLHGFEIIDATKNTITLENISETSPDKFNSIFRKLTFMLAQTVELLKEKEDIQQIKNQFYALSNFCRRSIVKHKLGGDASYHYYVYIYDLARIMHELSRITPTSKNKEHLNDLQKLLQILATIVHNEKLENIDELNEKIKQFQKTLDTLKQKEIVQFDTIAQDIGLAATKTVGFILK